jgi:hypothetical protein
MTSTNTIRIETCTRIGHQNRVAQIAQTKISI